MAGLQPERTLPLLQSYVSGTLLGGKSVAPDENLLLSGMLDSLSVMSLVAFTEDTFGLKIPFEDVIIENFETIAAIAEYLSTRDFNA
ncbi:MAG: acyl carrier protein [Pseudomonadota bacterium]